MVVYDEHRTSKVCLWWSMMNIEQVRHVYGKNEYRTSKVCLWWSMMNIEQVKCVYGSL